MAINYDRELRRYQDHGICRISLPDLGLGLDGRTVVSLENFGDATYVQRNKLDPWRHKAPSCIVIASSETKNTVPSRSLKVGEGVTGLEIRLEKVITGSGPSSFIGKYEMRLV